MTDKSEAQRRAYIEGIWDPAIRAREELAERMRKDPCLQAELEGGSNGTMVGAGVGFLGTIGAMAAVASVAGPVLGAAAPVVGRVISGTVGAAEMHYAHRAVPPHLDRRPLPFPEVSKPLVGAVVGAVSHLSLPVLGAYWGGQAGEYIGKKIGRARCESERSENEDVSQLPAIPGAVLAGYNPIDVTKDHVIDAPGGAKPTASAKGRTA